MNKLAKHGLINGFYPSNLFTNKYNCVACNKRKQHKASYKSITAMSTISAPLQLLHMDLFGPTSIRSIDHKYYSLVVTDDFSRSRLGHECYFDLRLLTDSLVTPCFQTNQPAGTQDTNKPAVPEFKNLLKDGDLSLYPDGKFAIGQLDFEHKRDASIVVRNKARRGIKWEFMLNKLEVKSGILIWEIEEEIHDKVPSHGIRQLQADIRLAIVHVLDTRMWPNIEDKCLILVGQVVFSGVARVPTVSLLVPAVGKTIPTCLKAETIGGSFHTSPPMSTQAPPEARCYRQLLHQLFLTVVIMKLIFRILPSIPSDKFAGGSDVPAGATTGPSADPSNKGKSPLLEEDPPVRERTFRQGEEDRLGKEAARRMYKEEQAELDREREEMQRKRQQDVLNSSKISIQILMD
ncbi:hypothetical protein Tco_0116784 [Tanacetum coccineum]